MSWPKPGRPFVSLLANSEEPELCRERSVVLAPVAKTSGKMRGLSYTAARAINHQENNPSPCHNLEMTPGDAHIFKHWTLSHTHAHTREAVWEPRCHSSGLTGLHNRSHRLRHELTQCVTQACFHIQTEQNSETSLIQCSLWNFWINTVEWWREKVNHHQVPNSSSKKSETSIRLLS